MQSVEQHSYRETKEQNSNGCKLIVKKDGMLDSLDAKERSYDNSANSINFTIRKVNLAFVFVVAVWIFFFNKYKLRNSTQRSLSPQHHDMTTNCDPMRCSHADHACYLDDD